MKSLINWDEILKLGRPEINVQNNDKELDEDGDPVTMWDGISEFYNKMAKMEKESTVDQVECFGITKKDTVLDLCCGPGRISVPAAKRAKSVTSLDSSKKMLELCKANAEEKEVFNLKTKYIDWKDIVPGENVEKHDIVIASRNDAIHSPEILSALANKVAGIVIWANSPSIPELMEKLFEGATDNTNSKKMKNRSDRRIGYNIIFNKVYDLGYEPNIKILDDYFRKTFSDRKKAYDYLLSLKPEINEDKYDIAKTNFDKYLEINVDGTIGFSMKTRSCVIWWEV